MAPVKKPKPILGSHFLRAWRVYRGVSQEAAAAAINVERGSLSKIENAKVPYQQQYVEGLARLYSCSPADLIGADPAAMPADAEAALRKALVNYGVDHADLGRAVSAVKVFLDGHDEQPSQAPHHDQSEPASPHHEEAPSRKRVRLSSS